jgi:hypothetical protein
MLANETNELRVLTPHWYHSHVFVYWCRVAAVQAARHSGDQSMKNYSRKTNRTVTRYRTPATFRVRAVIATQKTKLDNKMTNRGYGRRLQDHQ